ncbi:MAG TPA: methionine gamma-lyase family protein [Candidatus Caccopulliclostridium gallistercoris]|uniref:Methionine gamma-lyase family protein n=1 Tax=Candidatus Caccopulliclostridium gallistercoris TaxID=2840719 RepID=A0A9D1NDE8_9FIRM|nr:methionine gamma-lyase family protein [Candidatus Caccopulliclostridium gallistercoris]
MIAECEKNLKEIFDYYDDIALYNTKKVLKAFQDARVAGRHFFGSTGYGYGDEGRDKLSEVFAKVFGAESALVSPLITCGSHALNIALFGLLRPGDTIFSITGDPYDTLGEVVYDKNGLGSLPDFNIKFEKVELRNGEIDETNALKYIEKHKPKVVYIQRSRGYAIRDALSVDKMEGVFEKIKEISPNSFIMVDNCYGEFVEKREPTEVGADVIIGSLIKNAGGSLAPTGAYIAGTKKAVELIANRFTSASLGAEVGSFEMGYRLFFQGLFMAPHVTVGAIKGMYLIGEVMEKLGFNTMPKSNQKTYDIIKSIEFNTKEELIDFVQTIQKFSPVDSNVVPEPWDMPGYTEPVIMAAGTFVGGASIELSADCPIKKPYWAYLQGGITYEHCKLVTEELYKKFRK